MNNFKTWWEKRNFYGKYAAQQAWDASRKATLDEVRRIIDEQERYFNSHKVVKRPPTTIGKHILLQAIDELEGKR